MYMCSTVTCTILRTHDCYLSATCELSIHKRRALWNSCARWRPCLICFLWPYYLLVTWCCATNCAPALQWQQAGTLGCPFISVFIFLCWSTTNCKGCGRSPSLSATTGGATTWGEDCALVLWYFRDPAALSTSLFTINVKITIPPCQTQTQIY